MGELTSWPFTEPFLDRLMDYIDERYLRTGRDLGRLAFCFGGKRPALFLKRALARRIGRGFVPPRMMTIDEFVRYTVGKAGPFTVPRDLDQCYGMYHLAREITPRILKGREAFVEFLPWAREIIRFIDHLDLEDVDTARLENIEANARIGYPVPRDINRLLESVTLLRRAYHERMAKDRQYARGFQYWQAARMIDELSFPEFDRIHFCNFFYFTRTEEKVIKDLYDRDLAVLLFQGDERRWPVFRRAAKVFGGPVREGDEVRKPAFDLKLYAAFDAHSQVGQVRRILEEIAPADRDQTVIVLPDARNVIPLLSEIGAGLGDFNVSMGYPLKRSSLYSLLELIFQSQLSRREGAYYTRDYLRVLRHPLVKSLRLCGSAAVGRVLVHKIEEVLTGQEPSEISGTIFITPQELAAQPEVCREAGATLEKMGIPVGAGDLRAALEEIHALVFTGWEGMTGFAGFAASLERFMEAFLRKSSLEHYPLNLKIASRLLDIKDELARAPFAAETFPLEDIVRIFRSKMDHEIVAFAGSPLKGLQVLGLFETRSLNFKHVIVMDVNEGVLPALSIYEPFIPREVMINLNLDRLEQEEEIQRYQFMRLISSAEKVHLVYQESRDRERSRFVEELVWEAEKEAGTTGALVPRRPAFALTIAAGEKTVSKSPEMVDFLRGHRYSASGLNMYLRNPMEFYYHYVLGLREKEDLLDEPESRLVGTFVHGLLEEAFRDFLGRAPAVDAAFRLRFQELLDRRFRDTFGKSMASDAFLLKTALDTRLQLFLDREAEDPRRRVKEVLFIEKRFEDVLSLSGGPVNFVYQIDRVDRMEDGTVTIIDYKTGSVDPMPKAIERIETMDLSRESVYENVKSFQIPLYLFYLEKQFAGQPVNAAFYHLRTPDLHVFLDRRTNFDLARARTAFMRALDFVIGEILDPDVPFTDTGV